MVQKEKTMLSLTDEEYDALDEEMTKADLKLNFSKPGIITRQEMLLKALDEVSANYIRAKAEELHKIPTKIVAELIREKIANTNLLGDANEVGEVSVAKI
jgi:hypothetical protein